MEDQPDNSAPAETGGGGDSGGESSGMSTGMKVGIGIGILVAALLLILIFMQLSGGSGGSAPEEATPTIPIAPTATAETTEPGDNPSDGIIIIVPTPIPGEPTVTANVGVYIRSGPGTNFAIVGALAEGDTASAIGRTAAGDWWAIAMPGSPNGVGWVSAQYVTATDAENVPVLQPPPAPTATIPPPVAITEWKGEYFDNPNLEGNPVLVRNDARIDFNWGSGSPAPEVPNDNFSARWTVSRNAPKGIYEISIWVDDGVRLYIDEQLIINGWASGTARNYTAAVEVADGAHNIRVEYFESTGGALISLNIVFRGDAAAEAPNAVISGPTEGSVGEELLYTASGSTVQQGSHIVASDWNFGDGGTAAGTEVVHVYANPGVYTVQLALTDDKGLSSSAQQQVQINALPDADTPTPVPTEAPTEVVPVPTEAPTEVVPVPTEAPTEVVPVPTEAPTEVAPVPTEEVAPVAIISAPPTAVVGQPETFDGSASTAVNPIQSYVWDLGDGTIAEEAVFQYAYSAEGTYTVTLTVTDSAGLSSAAAMQIVVSAAAAP